MVSLYGLEGLGFRVHEYFLYPPEEAHSVILNSNSRCGLRPKSSVADWGKCAERIDNC